MPYSTCTITSKPPLTILWSSQEFQSWSQGQQQCSCILLLIKNYIKPNQCFPVAEKYLLAQQVSCLFLVCFLWLSLKVKKASEVKASETKSCLQHTSKLGSAATLSGICYQHKNNNPVRTFIFGLNTLQPALISSPEAFSCKFTSLSQCLSYSFYFDYELREGIPKIKHVRSSFCKVFGAIMEPQKCNTQ